MLEHVVGIYLIVFGISFALFGSSRNKGMPGLSLVAEGSWMGQLANPNPGPSAQVPSLG